MAAIPIGDPILQDATAALSGGVFTASVTWKLQVKLTGATLIDLLPDRVAYQFGSKLPAIASPYPFMPYCTCRDVDCKMGEKQGLYLFTAQYSDENSNGTSPATNTNPLFDEPEVLPIAGGETMPLTRDKDNYAILNAAGDPIIDSVTYNTLGFKVKSNVAGIPSYLFDVVNKTNNAPIMVKGLLIPRNVARIWLPNDWWSLTQRRNNYEFYEFKYELQLDYRNRHKGYPLNAGFRQRIWLDEAAGTTQLKVCTENEGSEVTSPVPLDPESAPPGKRLIDPQPEDVYYREVERLEEADFSVLPGVTA